MIRSLHFRLSVLMFLEYAIWGSWHPILSIHLRELGFSGDRIGWIYNAMGFGAVLAALGAGHLADRVLPLERVLAIAHAASGAAFLAASRATSFKPLFAAMLVQAILFAPTAGLANAMAFHHLPGRTREFNIVRLWGTAGWLAIAWAFGLFLGLFDRAAADGLDLDLAGWRAAVWSPRVGDCLTLAGVLSFLLAAWCLTLPHTPPVPARAEDRGSFREAFGLLRNRSIAAAMTATVLIAMAGTFYYSYVGIYFRGDPAQGGLGIPSAWVGPILTIGQVAEIAMMWSLSWFLARFGFRKIIAWGILACGLRFAIFAAGLPPAAALAAQALHGPTIAFFGIAVTIHVNQAAPAGMRARAQSLQTFLGMGVGVILGNALAGRVFEWCGGDFRMFYLVPTVISVVALGVFLRGFESVPSSTFHVPS